MDHSDPGHVFVDAGNGFGMRGGAPFYGCRGLWGADVPDGTVVVYGERDSVLCLQDLPAGNPPFDPPRTVAVRGGGRIEDRAALFDDAVASVVDAADRGRFGVRFHVYAYRAGDGADRDAGFV